MATLLITGGSGLVGRNLVPLLKAAGHEVRVLSRSARPEQAPGRYFWDPLNGLLDEQALEGVDGLIHLAGENIGAKPWTQQRRQAIHDSRVIGLDLLRKALEKRNQTLKTLISASAVGYYGSETTNNNYIETDPAATDFLGQICADWEAAALAFHSMGTRVVLLRTSLVLSRQAGVLPLLSRLGQLGLLAPLGSGLQHMPWIHLDDLCRLYQAALDNPRYEGPYNAVAPEACTNRQFTLTLAAVLTKTVWLPPVPAFILRLMVGKRSILLLEGSRVSAQKMLDAGFSVKYPTLKRALSREYGPR